MCNVLPWFTFLKSIVHAMNFWIIQHFSYLILVRFFFVLLGCCRLAALFRKKLKNYKYKVMFIILIVRQYFWPCASLTKLTCMHEIIFFYWKKMLHEIILTSTNDAHNHFFMIKINCTLQPSHLFQISSL